MTAEHRRDEEGVTIVQLTPSFWSLVLSVAIALVTITVTIVTRPDEQKVQQMIDGSIQKLESDVRRVDEKIDYTREYTGAHLNRIEDKIDQLNGGR